MTGVVVGLGCAGVETIADTMRWFFACMATHPEVQQRLFEEVHSVLGDGGRLQMSQLGVKSLNYLQAVQYEVQRFGSTAQIMPPHQACSLLHCTCRRTTPPQKPRRVSSFEFCARLLNPMRIFFVNFPLLQ